MLTIHSIAGYRNGILATFALLLAGCAVQPELHSFGMPFEPGARPDAAVRYTLREEDPQAGLWRLRGEQGDVVGEFRVKPGFKPVEVPTNGLVERNDLVQDGVNQVDYLLRIQAPNAGLGDSMSRGTVPRVTAFDAASGRRLGALDLRSGYDLRFDGDWNGRQVWWRVRTEAPAQLENEVRGVMDTYPASQQFQWAGGSNADVNVYSGRKIEGEQFKELIFDLQAGRPLTRREIGEAVSMLFAIRGVQEAAVVAASR